MKPND